jgi:XapX domain-containing protein
MKVVLGLSIGFFLGAACRWLDIPVPSPPKLLGALLVVATTLGYMAMDGLLARRQSAPAPQESARTLQAAPDR